MYRHMARSARQRERIKEEIKKLVFFLFTIVASVTLILNIQVKKIKIAKSEQHYKNIKHSPKQVHTNDTQKTFVSK